MTKPDTSAIANAEPRFNPYRMWGTVAGLATAIYGYIQYWPMWQVLVLGFGVPFVSLVVWIATSPGTIRRYRFLLLVYGLAVPFAAYELWATKKLAEPVTEFLNIKAGPGDADVLFQYDFPRFLAELYPERSETLFARGLQVQMCVGFRGEGKRIPICERLETVSLQEAQRHFKAAIDTGNRTVENVLYHYAMFLNETGASEKEVAAALAEWKRHYPFSKRFDPRTASRAIAD